MFNISGPELLVVAFLALVVLGPQRLPDAARQIGKFLGELRRMSSGFQSEVRTALDQAEREARDKERAATGAPARPSLPPLDPDVAAAVASEQSAGSPNGSEPAAGTTPRQKPAKAKATAKAKKAPAGQAAAKKAAGRKAAAGKAPAKKKAAAKAAAKRASPARKR